MTEETLRQAAKKGGSMLPPEFGYIEILPSESLRRA
jgi:hypothetical protein